MSEMRSEPIPKATALFVGGPVDGELREVPVTKSGTPQPFTTAVVTATASNGVVVRRSVPYRLEWATNPGAHAVAAWRYVALNVSEPMPEHDWDSALSEIGDEASE